MSPLTLSEQQRPPKSNTPPPPPTSSTQHPVLLNTILASEQQQQLQKRAVATLIQFLSRLRRAQILGCSSWARAPQISTESIRYTDQQIPFILLNVLCMTCMYVYGTCVYVYDMHVVQLDMYVYIYDMYVCIWHVCGAPCVCGAHRTMLTLHSCLLHCLRQAFFCSLLLTWGQPTLPWLSRDFPASTFHLALAMLGQEIRVEHSHA